MAMYRVRLDFLKMKKITILTVYQPFDIISNISEYIPANTKHLYNIFRILAKRRERCTTLYVVQMLYKCFAFAGVDSSKNANRKFMAFHNHGNLQNDFYTHILIGKQNKAK